MLAIATNWRILSEQWFTAHMYLLAATCTLILKLGTRCYSSQEQCYLVHHLQMVIPEQMEKKTEEDPIYLRLNKNGQ